MKIIKLDTIGSTNSFLKELNANSKVENYTIVVSKNQTSGRGQMNTSWHSEDGKNLIFSILVRFEDLLITKQKYLNYAISISVFETLKYYNLPEVSIKWPNDILSEKNKIVGILIENSLRLNKISSSIIGIGMNVNQEFFPENIPNPSSLKLKTGLDFNLDEVLKVFFNFLNNAIELLNQNQFEVLEEKYLNVLYKKNVPSVFKTNQDEIFKGEIVGISPEGKLQIELSNMNIKEFGLKEVSFA